MIATMDVEVLSPESSVSLRADSYDYNRLPPELRDQAMLAQGTVVTKLSGAVDRVIDAGNTLRWAKETLPHGEYLPWVQQACGLKPQHASRLIKAAEWANVAHAQLLDGVTDATTLFLLSADTTSEEVREWFMERCAAGDPPTRREVQERKRSAGQPRDPEPTEALALTILRKGELDRMREALALAERAQVVSPDQVMEEQRLRDLGKARYLAGLEADFHRMKDGSWIRMPHAGRVDAVPCPSVHHKATFSPIAVSGDASDGQRSAKALTIHQAAQLFGMSSLYLQSLLTPSRIKKRGPFVRQGLRVERAGRGMVMLTPV